MYLQIIYMNKPDLALNNQQWLIYYQSKPNQTKLFLWKILKISFKYHEAFDSIHRKRWTKYFEYKISLKNLLPL